MKQLLLLTLLLYTFCFNAVAQLYYEKGYFIDNDGNKVECLIRNDEKLFNPDQFMYKLSENAEVNTGTLDAVKEFAIYNTTQKYQRYNVQIDRSSDNLKDLSYSREPDFRQEQLFLKVLVDGKASLYMYNKRGRTEKYFYKTDSTDIEQLVYKRYMMDDTKFSENKAFRQQLWVSLQCPSLSTDEFEKVDYEQKELKKLFAKYNDCVGHTFTDYSKKEKAKGEFSFTFKAGANYAVLELKKKTGFTYTETLNPKISPQVGFETAYFLPFNKKSWSIFFEPSFIYYSNEHAATIFGRDAILEINYLHFMLPLGIKHFIYLNEENKLFLQGAYSYNYLVNQDKAIEINNINFNAGFEHDNTNLNSVMFGGGYHYKNRYTIEAVYHLNKVMADGRYWQNSFTNSLSLTLGYRIR